MRPVIIQTFPGEVTLTCQRMENIISDGHVMCSALMSAMCFRVVVVVTVVSVGCVTMTPLPQAPREDACLTYNSCLHPNIGFDEDSCYCDALCNTYGDCCYDSQFRNTSLQKLDGSSELKCTTDKVYAKAWCKDGWSDANVEDLCVGGGVHTDPISRVPVTSNITGYTYSNYYCAICNEDILGLTIWKVKLMCNLSRSDKVNMNDFVFRNNTWGVLLGDPESRVYYPCSLSSQIPTDIKHLTRSCSQTIGTCGEDWQDEEVAAQCHSYTAVVYHASNRYRNPHCARCNKQDDYNCSQQIFLRIQPAFALLFDFTDPSRSNLVGSSSPCNTTQVWDPFFKRCRSIVCPKPNQDYRDGRCVTLRDANSLVGSETTAALTSSNTTTTENPTTTNTTSITTTDSPTNTNATSIATDSSTNTTDSPITTNNITSVNNSNTNTTSPDSLFSNTTTVPPTTHAPVKDSSITHSPGTLPDDKQPIIFPEEPTEPPTTPTEEESPTTPTEKEDTPTSPPSITPKHPIVFPEDPTEPSTTPKHPIVFPEDPTEPSTTPKHPIVFPEDPTEPSTTPKRSIVFPEDPTEPSTTPKHPIVFPEDPTEPSTTPKQPIVFPEDPTEPSTTPKHSIVFPEDPTEPFTTPIPENTSTSPPPTGVPTPASPVTPAIPLLPGMDTTPPPDVALSANTSSEFAECNKVILLEGEFVELPNGTVHVEEYGRIYSPGEYARIKKGLMVCQLADIASYSRKFSPALGWVSLAGLSLSCTSLLLHLAAFALLPELRNLSGRNLASLCLALLAAYITFLINMLMRPPSAGCVILAAAMYYFFVTSFTWMSVIAFDVWYTFHLTQRQLRVSSGNQWHRFIAYSIYSWLLPAAATVVLLVVDQLEPSGIPIEFLPRLGHTWCWFSHRKSLLAFFAAPMVILIVMNCIFFVSTAAIITQTGSTAAAASARGNHPRGQYKMYLRLAVLMGFTWMSGIAAGYLGLEALWYVFVVLNTLQGVFIFLAFTFRTRVWQGVGTTCNKLVQRGLSKVTRRSPPSDIRAFELSHTPEATSASYSTPHTSLEAF